MTAYSELLIYSGVLFIVVAIVFFAFLVMMNRLVPRLFLPTIGLVVGVAVALYAQGNLIGADYGALDGHVIRWETMRSVAIANSLIWGACVCIPVIAAIICKKIAEVVFRYFVPVFLAYVALLSVMLIIANVSAADRKKPVGFTLDRLMELSSERNLVVIVLDAFDRAIFDRLLAQDPGLRNRFAGFTYYHNAVSAYCYTNLALPHIVSGYCNADDDLEVWQLQRKAYHEAPLLKMAMELGYKIDAYYDIDDGPVVDDFSWAGTADNVIENANRFVSSNNLKHYGYLYFSSVFRYLPHEMKKLWCKLNDLLKEEYSLFSEKGEESLASRLWSESFSLVSEKKVKFYHCFSIHVPSFSLERARENLEMVCRFFEKAREVGIYEKTDFFVMADHGSINRCRPLFMCSNGTEEFKVSEMPFSYRHLREVFVDSLYGRMPRPIEANMSEMVPIIDDPKRRDITTVDGKYFDGIGTEFFGNGLELLATTAEMDVVVTNGSSRMIWNGNDAIIGVPVEEWLRDGELSLTLTFDRKMSTGLNLAVQYGFNNPQPADFHYGVRPHSEETDVFVKLPDMSKNPDKRFVKLHFRKWEGPQLAPSIVKVKIAPCGEVP